MLYKSNQPQENTVLPSKLNAKESNISWQFEYKYLNGWRLKLITPCLRISLNHNDNLHSRFKIVTYLYFIITLFLL